MEADRLRVLQGQSAWRDRGQRLAEVLILTVTLILTLASGAAALGWMAWPDLHLSFAGDPLPHAGIWAQLGLTVLMLALLLYLPANRRMARLEAGHRSFAMGVEDVSRAYRLAHAADRAGVFSLSSEFDSIRARMEQLRQHPDFGHLEPELLQMAAQMSHETRALAEAYSDKRVARAKGFLQQRQEEVQALNDRLALARTTCDELRRWLTDVESDERQARIQLKRLEADLREILPGLGYAVDFEGADLAEAEAAEPPDGNVVALQKPLPVRPTPRPLIRPDRPETR